MYVFKLKKIGKPSGLRLLASCLRHVAVVLVMQLVLFALFSPLYIPPAVIAASDQGHPSGMPRQDGEQIMLPVSNLPIVGNYCTVQAGASLHDAPYTGNFAVEVAGTPIRSYWFWTGRSVNSPIGDDTILVSIENANGSQEAELTAQQVLSGADPPFVWHSNGYRDDALAYVTSGLNTYSISDFFTDNDAKFNHGVGIIVIYESESCPYTQVNGWFGLDSFHWSRAGELGPDSNIMCESFTASESTRRLSFRLAIGGVAGPDRGNSIWYITGNGDYPTSITPDENDVPNPAAIEIFDPLNGDPGHEWDFSSTELIIPPGDTFACAQIESPADDNGISAVWSGLVTSMPIDRPDIEIQKVAEPSLIRSGGEVTFTVQITNTGKVTLTDVVIADTLAPSCDISYPALAPGAVATHSCTVDNVTEPFTNVATVSGNPPVGTPVTDSDDASVDIYIPAIEIQKTPDEQTIESGSTATFAIRVRNTGDITLTNVTVTDPLAPNCNRSVNVPMAPGAEFSYSCEMGNVLGPLVNVAETSGTAPDGSLVTDSDAAIVNVVESQAPAIADISLAKLPDEQMVPIGATATFTIRIQNNGEVPLTDVIVTDPNVPACDRIFPGLAVNQIEEYTCVTANIQASFTNTASVIGNPPSGLPVTDSDNAQVTALGPAIEIEKSPDLQTVPTGTDVTFTIKVTNVGDIALTDVTVSDALAPACTVYLGTLAPGQEYSYTCVLNDLQESITNVATVTGNPPFGSAVTDQDDADVVVKLPDITIVKTASAETVLAGSPVNFSIRVTNNGEVPLSNVAVVDPLVPSCSAELGNLDVGEANEYSCTFSQVVHPFTNVATVTGTSSSGQNVSATDTATVTPLTPAISISKFPDVQLVDINETAAFTIVVRNMGEVTLADVTVTDPIAPGCDRFLGNLPVGEQRRYTCTLAGITQAITNTAVVTGTPIIPGIVGDTPKSADKDVTDEDIAVVEIAALAVVGDLVWLDQNLNGQQDAGEPGVEGVSVILRSKSNTIVGTTSTNSEGIYLFSNIEPGEYQVEFSLPDGYNFTETGLGPERIDSDPNVSTGRTALFELGSNARKLDVDAGLVGTPSLVLVKKDAGEVAQPGGNIFYTLAVTNTGNTSALDVIITEFLPDNTTYSKELSPPGWECTENPSGDTQCIYSLGNLAPGATVQVTFVVKVDTPLPISITGINNEASVNSSNGVSGKDVISKRTPLTPTSVETIREPTFQERFYIPLFR